MNEDLYVSLISSVGFPIAVTSYLLIRQEKIVKELTTAVNDLRVVVAAKIKDVL